jgi:hypothetical protein
MENKDNNEIHLTKQVILPLGVSTNDNVPFRSVGFQLNFLNNWRIGQ